jgi:metal-sulfur cluster biosynthetic enzyme
VSASATALRDAVVEALGGVRDPELDEPLPALGFVSSVEVDDGRARVRLRLPTYFCAANFAYLMVSDARAAILSVPGIEEAHVALDDHYADAEINGSVDVGGGFEEAFPGEAGGELGELRDLFARKALLVRESRVAEGLVRAGLAVEELAAMRVGDLPDGPDTRAYLARRAELGFDTSPSAPAMVRGDGSAVTPAELARHLRIARTVRVSVEGNAGLCRGLLKTRYGIPDPEEEDPP